MKKVCATNSRIQKYKQTNNYCADYAFTFLNKELKTKTSIDCVVDAVRAVLVNFSVDGSATSLSNSICFFYIFTYSNDIFEIHTIYGNI